MNPTSSSTRAEALVVTGNTTHTAPENRAFYPALDGVRAVAFLMVFGWHYLYLPWGWTGVDMFFVLSGFLITGILFDTRNNPNRARNFYVRRTLRIFPLYYGVMLSMLLLTPLMHWQWNWKWLVWPSYLGNFARFVHPYAAGQPLQRLADFQPVAAVAGRRVPFFLGHFWSLCVEEQFYFVWPWVVFGIRDRRKLAILCVLTLPACLALRLAGQHLLPQWMLQNEILYRWTPLRLDSLLLGGLIALLLRGPNPERLLAFARRAFPFALGAVVLLLLSELPQRLWHYPDHYPPWKFTWGLSTVDLFFGLLVLVALQPQTWTHRILSRPWLRWIGRLTYGAYVLHDIPHVLYAYFAEVLVQRVGSPMHLARSGMQWSAALVAAMLALSMTLLLSWLSFRYFESYFLNLKEKWTVSAQSRNEMEMLQSSELHLRS